LNSTLGNAERTKPIKVAKEKNPNAPQPTRVKKKSRRLQIPLLLSMVTGSSRLLNASYFTLEQNRRHKPRFVMDRHSPPVTLGVAAMTGTALAHVGIMSKQELFPGAPTAL